MSAETATVSAESIVCPAWCTVTKEQHHADLHLWEGRVIHDSAWRKHAEWRTYASVFAEPDGTPSGHFPRAVIVNTAREDLTPDEAEALALAILEAVKEARA